MGIAPAQENFALKLIELAGRTAYKSEAKITEESALEFVAGLKRRGHLSVLEHSNIVFAVHDSFFNPALIYAMLRERGAFHRAVQIHKTGYVCGNIRAWIETMQWASKRYPDDRGSFLDSFEFYLHKHFPSLFPEGSRDEDDIRKNLELVNPVRQVQLLDEDPNSDLPVFVFKFICDRGITHEVVRHRVLSFTQESTRYVNHSNRGMTLILPDYLEPYWNPETLELDRKSLDSLQARVWLNRALEIFDWYKEDLKAGLKPQIARDILPNLLKAEIVVSGRWSGWKHFLELRDSEAAHPRIRFIAREVRKWFESQGLVTG